MYIQYNTHASLHSHMSASDVTREGNLLHIMSSQGDEYSIWIRSNLMILVYLPIYLRYKSLTTRTVHMCVTHGVTHKCVCILDSTRVYTHTQYLHMCVCLYGYCSYQWQFWPSCVGGAHPRGVGRGGSKGLGEPPFQTRTF